MDTQVISYKDILENIRNGVTVDNEQLEFAIKDARMHAKAEDRMELLKKFMSQNMSNALLTEKLLSYGVEAISLGKSDELQVANVFNHLGIICFYNREYNHAISFYHIGLLQSDSKKFECTAYHNIADCLLQLGHKENSEHYFKIAFRKLEEATWESDGSFRQSKDFKRALFSINMAECLIKSDKIAEAVELIDKIDSSFGRDPHLGSLYRFIKLMLELKTGSTELSRTRLNELKRELENLHNPSLAVEANNTALELLNDISKEEIEELLIESLQFGEQLHNVAITREFLVKLIEFYGDENPKEQLIHLKKLYELDRQKQTSIQQNIIEIIIKEYNYVFESLKNKSQLINNQKEELQDITYILSHDLKTPLRTIHSFTSILEKNLDIEKDPLILDSVSYIINSTKKLYQLVEDISLFNKFQRSNVEFEDVDLSEVIDQVVRDMSGLIEEKEANIEFINNLPGYFGLQSDFYLLFSNLIENGIKYNKSKKIKISIKSTQRDGFLEIAIRDNGIGIEEEYFERIFSFFKRLHNDEEYEGTGFGLGICRKIVDKYKGKIKVESTLNKGSVFKIILPLLK